MAKKGWFEKFSEVAQKQMESSLANASDEEIKDMYSLMNDCETNWAKDEAGCVLSEKMGEILHSKKSYIKWVDCVFEYALVSVQAMIDALEEGNVVLRITDNRDGSTFEVTRGEWLSEKWSSGYLGCYSTVWLSMIVAGRMTYRLGKRFERKLSALYGKLRNDCQRMFSELSRTVSDVKAVKDAEIAYQAMSALYVDVVHQRDPNIKINYEYRDKFDEFRKKLEMLSGVLQKEDSERVRPWVIRNWKIALPIGVSVLLWMINLLIQLAGKG